MTQGTVRQTQKDMVYYLLEARGIAMSSNEIASRLKLGRSSVSSVCSRLVKEGIAKATRGPGLVGKGKTRVCDLYSAAMPSTQSSSGQSTVTIQALPPVHKAAASTTMAHLVPSQLTLHARIVDLMADGAMRTTDEIATALNAPLSDVATHVSAMSQAGQLTGMPPDIQARVGAPVYRGQPLSSGRKKASGCRKVMEVMSDRTPRTRQEICSEVAKNGWTDPTVSITSRITELVNAGHLKKPTYHTYEYARQYIDEKLVSRQKQRGVAPVALAAMPRRGGLLGLLRRAFFGS